MNAKSLAPFILASTTVVIDVNGDVRELLPGEVPAPGEVIVVLGQDATANADSPTGIEAQLIGEGGNLDLNLDNEIASIIEQIEQGVDPTQNDDFATAAGGQDGSSLTGSGDIDRTGTETLAETQFDTSGLESQGLSETQSLALLDIVAAQLVIELEAPVFDAESYDFSYDENSEPGTVIGTVSATDLEGDTVTYSLVFEDGDPLADYFAIDSDTGEISLTEAGAAAFSNDFEDEGSLNSHDIVVQASDGTNISQVLVTLNELDVNEAPEFDQPEGGYSFTYNENSSDAYVIGTVTATDEDAGDVVSYSISSNVQVDGQDLFEIDSATGEISLTAAGVAAFTNDYELPDNQHTITVVASDGELETSVDVDLSELDLNEAPEFDQPEGGYSFTYNENSSDAYVIGTVTATDEDAGDVVSYSISSNVQLAGQDLFEIDSVTGEISLTAAGVDAFTNNYELPDNQHTITVVASDGELETSVDVNLSELDLNEAPEFDQPEGGYSFTYNENSSDA
ncbi:cadherin domain-containing protein, partial [Vibrio brasiliensis]